MTAKKDSANLKICELCGGKFSCEAENNDCWCFKVEIPAENLAQLEKRFERCLCPRCLKSFSACAETASTQN